MNDDVKAAVGVGAWDSASGCSKDEWYAIGRLKMNNACDAPDVDPSFWEDLSLILAHIDGEPARIAAACEEVREACAQQVPSIGQPHDCFKAVRATPLTATPMSDPFCRRCRQPLGGTHLPDCIWEDLVVPSECDGVIEEAIATVKARNSSDYARGVADERARVVAWLRAKGWQVGKQQRVVMFTVADRIEGSKHEEKP
jgi:hypothetical protein